MEMTGKREELTQGMKSVDKVLKWMKCGKEEERTRRREVHA